MESTIPISSQTLKTRRQELKKKRRERLLASMARTFALVGFATGVFWVVTLPHWIISNSEQIKIEGNKYLSLEEVRSLIPLSYPQPLLKLSVEDLKANLKTKVPFEDVVVRRKMLPPQITITVVEREPVAMAMALVNNPKTKQSKLGKIGYLDSEGILVTNEFYQNVPEELNLPTFKIIGAPEQYLPYWQDLYYWLQQSEVKIKEINWQDPNNLILKTELGDVYIGAFTPKFPEQLQKLAQMKGITRLVPRSQIIYIDLTEPQSPVIKQKTPSPKPKEVTVRE
jgi:cell division protein FtsQ